LTEPQAIITPALIIAGTVRVYGRRMSFHASGQWASPLRPGTCVRIVGFGDRVFTDCAAEVSRRDYLGENVYRLAVWRTGSRKK
jgi:hypothetical protein